MNKLHYCSVANEKCTKLKSETYVVLSCFYSTEFNVDGIVPSFGSSGTCCLTSFHCGYNVHLFLNTECLFLLRLIHCNKKESETRN